MKLSIVATLYRSSAYIEEFCSRAAAAAQAQVGDDYEIVLVNDGSPDDSLAQALALRAKDDRIVVVDLSRNFGHHKAILAGLNHSRGDLVFLLDVDLEDQPEWLARFWKELHETTPSPDVVYGTQATRTGSGVGAFGGWAFYKLFNTLSESQVPESPTTARLMRRTLCRCSVSAQRGERLHGRHLRLDRVSAIGHSARNFPRSEHVDLHPQ